MRNDQRYIPLFTLLAVLLFAPCAFPQSPPQQPASGPGGSDYPHAAISTKGPYWASGHFLDNNFTYYIYEPAKPTPTVAPIILFIHGWLAYSPNEYMAWISHIVRKGYVVVWVQYDAGLRPFQTFEGNAMATWKDALNRLATYWWEPHVRPEVNGQGGMKTAIVGHSVGGYLGAILAARAADFRNEIPKPYAVVAIEPAGERLILAPDFANIDPATKMIIVVADEDDAACKATGIAIWEGTPQIPNQNRDFLLVKSDKWGLPAQLANHFFPNTSGFGDTAAVDARDFYVTFKLSVGALNCAFRGTDCEYALGHGRSEQVETGWWSDGVAVRPMTWVDNPNGLTTKCNYTWSDLLLFLGYKP